MRRSSPAQTFLDALAGGGSVSGERVAVVVAHPDDETLGLGAQLPRLPGIAIVHVTDGAPRDLGDARRLGFETAVAYSAARRRELETAMALAGIGSDALIGLGVPDQEAAYHLAAIANRLADVFCEKRIEIVFTHAYEGGHPDHDATACAVHAAADIVAHRLSIRTGIIDMPFYRAAPDGWAVQQFIPDPDSPECTLRLDDGQRELKARMFAAHRSQAGVLDRFPIEVERFRAAPDYDFARLPPVAELLYERENWGLTGARWLDLVRQARHDLARDLTRMPA